MKRRRFFLCVWVLLVLSPISVRADGGQIRILYMNDFHGFAEPCKSPGSDAELGGIAYLAGEENRLRADRTSLFLAAGDMIQGNSWANFTTGESVIELMNLMGFDAMVVGNHEFDFGQDVLKTRISEATFPILGANVEGLKDLKPFVIKDVSGIRVAVIGVVTEEAAITTDPKNVVGLRILSPEAMARRYVDELKDRADILIVLSHIGYAEDRLLAERVKGIDVIVGGHSHTKLVDPVIIGDTIIVQAWEHAKALGVLDLEVRDNKIVSFTGKLEEIMPGTGPENIRVSRLVEKYEGTIDTVLAEILGETNIDLDGEHVRVKETNLGDLITDIMRSISGADAAIINGGSIRTGIKKGEIRRKDVYNVLPFNSYIVSARLTGRQIREALEYGVAGIEEGSGRFPQVSGIRFTFCRSESPGRRVRDILVEGVPLEPDREYVVATNDFLAAGGDGYKVFGEAVNGCADMLKTKAGGAEYCDSGRWLRDAVAEYIREKKIITSSAGDRITQVGESGK